MAAVVLCWTLLTVGFLGSASEAPDLEESGLAANDTQVRENIIAHSGEKVTLQCQSPVDEDFKVLEWSRSDHEELIYVFLYRDGQFDPENQHPSFENRVELKDKQMKNGDMSLILRNVTINDTGTYECRVNQKASRTVLGTDPIKVINLEVNNNGQDLGPKVWQNITEVRENITAHSGDKVTLQCQSPVDKDFKVLEWSRSDHEELIYVFLYRDGQFDPEKQHPSFKDRVELEDKQMKNGNVSLILSSVTINDTGTYECRIDQRASATFIRTNLIKVINLEVTNNVVQNVSAYSGDNVMLPCQHKFNESMVLEWSRSDHEKPVYVFLYRDENFTSDCQHPSFKDRVKLKDKQMKDGDLSLILNNVTTNDTGTYECRVDHKVSRSYLRTDPIKVINLEVTNIERKNITAHSGENVRLQCQSPVDKDVKVLEWSRSDHEELIYVFLYQDGKFEPEKQHPSFKDRVELEDKQMKNGNVSLILSSVTINDTGTYECRIDQRASATFLRTNLIKVINLEVTNNGQVLGPEFWQNIIGGQRDGKVQEYVGLMLYQIVFLLFLLL
ncbi:uncharacterized protein LOC114858704 [Betta splendens]|uniref:Uncharacterized protein LOC114858704 n=1 Tax=Betta splendens TaxID=158456 RepID=A0A9W2XX08_BETSP|nr:uncharacterized protein LOC114858704 [Betta splendens]